MNIRKGHEIELIVDRTAHGGQGVARVDGFVVFVKGGVPGDRVLARVFRKKKGYAEAGVLEVLAPSPDRIDPACPYSGMCGGCQWQHIRYEAQLRYKRSHVREALERIGGLEGVPVRETLPSEKIFGYRNKMEFSFSDRRWLLPEELEDPSAGQRDFALGLHAPGTFNRILDVEACNIQPPLGNEILGAVRAYAMASGLPPYGFKTHEGFWRFCMLRHSTAEDAWMVNIITSEDRPDAVRPLSRDLAARFPQVRTVVNNITSRQAAVAFGEAEVVYAGEGFLKESLGPHTFQISANSFFQTNTGGAETLYRVVEEYAGLTGRETVLDLYCGTGTIGIFLSGRAVRVLGAEIVESSVEDARKNAARNGIDNCSFTAGDLRETLSRLHMDADVMIVDPPRAGVHKDILKGILKKGCGRIVYVSCNPATLARDLAEMSEMYDILEIQPVDLFPHTYHVESVARLVRKGD